MAHPRGWGWGWAGKHAELWAQVPSLSSGVASYRKPPPEPTSNPQLVSGSDGSCVTAITSLRIPLAGRAPRPSDPSPANAPIPHACRPCRQLGDPCKGAELRGSLVPHTPGTRLLRLLSLCPGRSPSRCTPEPGASVETRMP